MTSRDERIETEAQALWRELYDEPPPADVDGASMIDAMLNRLPEADYKRLNSPFLRRGQMSWPKDR